MTRTEELRPIVERMDRDVTRLAARAGDQRDGAALVASWAKLVDFLALGPAPDLADCPHCGASGIRAATRCGQCWAKLTPAGAHAS
jgi:hypothetical protein